MKKASRSFFYQISLIGIVVTLFCASCQDKIIENTNTWTTYKADAKSTIQLCY